MSSALHDEGYELGQAWADTAARWQLYQLERWRHQCGDQWADEFRKPDVGGAIARALYRTDNAEQAAALEHVIRFWRHSANLSPELLSRFADDDEQAGQFLRGWCEGALTSWGARKMVRA